MSTDAQDFPTENGHFDDDTESDTDAAADYYHPISTYSDSDESSNPLDLYQSNGSQAANGISSLHLSDDSDEDEDREERGREESVSRVFRQDASRRSAPLTPENTSRIMEAMRGISFPGIAPDWVNRVPEDSWVDQLRRLRGETN